MWRSFRIRKRFCLFLIQAGAGTHPVRKGSTQKGVEGSPRPLTPAKTSRSHAIRFSMSPNKHRVQPPTATEASLPLQTFITLVHIHLFPSRLSKSSKSSKLNPVKSQDRHLSGVQLLTMVEGVLLHAADGAISPPSRT